MKYFVPMLLAPWALQWLGLMKKEDEQGFYIAILVVNAFWLIDSANELKQRVYTLESRFDRSLE